MQHQVGTRVLTMHGDTGTVIARPEQFAAGVATVKLDVKFDPRRIDPTKDVADYMDSWLTPLVEPPSWVVVRCLLGDEIGDLGDEVEVFGPYVNRDDAKIRRQQLIDHCRAEAILDLEDFEAGISIAKLKR